MKNVLIKVEGMTCAGCSSSLEKYLNKQQGIIKAEVNLVMSNAKIEYDEQQIDLETINKYVSQAGFKSLGIDKFELEKRGLKRERINLSLTIILSLFTIYLSMGSMLDLPNIDYLSKVNNPKIYSIVLFVLTTVIIILSIKTIINGVKKILHKMPNMDSLISIGVITSYIYSTYLLLQYLYMNTKNIDNIYFESAVMVLLFTKIGKYIDNKNKIKTKEAITKLTTITPTKATIIKESEERVVSIDLIEKGDIVICRPGERIAVDGVIVNGISHVNESFITGESLPKEKKIGDNVVAGSINIDGYIEYRAERIGKDTAVSEIVKMAVDAVNTKPQISRVADRICYYFVPSVIVIAIISLITWLAFGKNIGFAINIFVSCLVVACPCALGLATPLAIVSAVSNGVKNGILIKNSKVLEIADKIDTVVFDKTGTLTKGKLSISKINIYGNMSENGILQLIGSIERKSEHPVAKAIIDRCLKQSIKLSNIKEVELIQGKGAVAKYRGQNVLIGSKNLMIENDIALNKEIDEMYESGNIIVHLCIEKEHIATIELNDVIKDSAKETVKKLKSNNIHVVMMTGDNEKAASVIAKELEIDTVIAGVLPKDKVNKINELKKSSKNIMMVGDGINDAPSLISANIGVSLEGATDIALDSSDVIVLNSDLSKIYTLLSLSKKTIKIIKQNLFWAFIYNIIMIPIATGILYKFNILINPMYSSLAMTISSIIVVINSLRLKKRIK